MRFDRFQLARFGHFSDVSLAFPSPHDGAADLHIITGVNEAGKSTFRIAVTELLFGFDERTPFAFRHAYPELLLGADLRSVEGQESVLRAKKRTHSLSRPEGGPLPDNHLARLLGGLDKASYLRQFALDHAMLTEGGRRLLESRSDLSQLLFEAASGVADFAALQREMGEQAGRLWKQDGRAKTVYREAARSLAAASKAKRAAVTTGGNYEKLQQTFERSQRDRDGAREALLSLERERGRLERLRRIAPLFAKADDLASEIARLSPAEVPAPRLADDAAEQLENLRRQDAVLRALIGRKATEREALQAEVEAQVLDPVVTDQAERIEALTEQRAQVQELPLQIDRRRRDVDRLERQALDQAKHIGWTCTARKDLQACLPAALQRNELRGLLQQKPALDERVKARRSAVEILEADLADLRAKLAELPSDDRSEALDGAIEQARRLGDLDRQHRDLERARDQERDALEALRQDLSPWSGDWASLKTPPAVLYDQAADRLREDAELMRRLESETVKDKEINERLRVAEAELESRRQQHEIVDRATLLAARRSRDSLWRGIRDGKLDATEAAPRFERQIEDADALADRRFESAEAVSQTDQLVTEVRKLQALLGVAQTERERLKLDVERRAADWARSMTGLGLPGLSPAQYGAWLECRQQALQGLARSERAESNLETFLQRCASAAAALAAALGSEANESASQALSDLERLLGVAEAKVEASQRVAGERKQGEEARGALERRLDAARRDQLQIDKQEQAWSGRWASGLATCGLPGECGAETADDALDRMAEIETLLGDIESLESDRIEKMRHDLDAFARAATDLADDVDPALATSDPSEIARTVSTRLASAREAESRHRTLSTQLQQVRQDLEEAEAGLDRLRAVLSPMMTDARVADPMDLEALARAIKVSDQIRDLESQRRRVREELVAAAEGEAIEDLRQALDGTPAEERALRVDELDREQSEARQALEDSTERWTEARTALRAIGGGDASGSAAAHAEEDRQEAIARMTTVVSDYSALYLKAGLLRWAIDRYSAEFRSPLLARASSLFRSLTLDRYQDLLVDLEPDQPSLQARGAGGELVGLEGLSDGTRDQLFMALRIAAIELHLDQATALPFIADDLLINFDNDRAAAAFRVLGELGRRTQVLYLSHHDHLVALARETLGNELNVVRL